MTAKIPVDRKRAFRMAGALVGLAVVLGACTHADDQCDREHSRRLSPASSDRDSGSQPVGRDLRRPCARRPFRRATRRRDGAGANLAPRGNRRDHRRFAGRYAQRAGGRGLAARNPFAAGGGRRAAARHHRAPLSSGRPAPDGDDPAELSENLGGGGTLRPVAGGSRALDQEQELFREQAVLQFRLRLPAQHGRDGRQSGRPCAAAARNRRLYGAAHAKRSRSIARARRPRRIYPEADKAKLSDTGK